MKTINKIYLAILLMILVFAETNAQNKVECGTYKIDTAALRKAMDFEKKFKGNRIELTSPVVIRVFFHICEPDGGLLIVDKTEADINVEFQHLVSAYSSDNICFVNCGFDYVNASEVDTFNIDKQNKSAFYPYGVSNCLNVFYLDKIGGKNGACSDNCGIGGNAEDGIPGTFCIVSKDQMGLTRNTVGHEVGHCLGLLHTFETNYGHEKIDGSNGSSSADLVADTPADPYVFNSEGNTCYATTNFCNFSCCSAQYSGTCTDPNGATNYSPPYSNLMSYWRDACLNSPIILTTGQFNRINSILNTNALLQTIQSQNVVTEGTNINVSSGFHMNSAATVLTTSGTVIYSNIAQAALGGTQVKLEAGFHAVPAAGGRVLIRPATCN